MSHSSQNLGNQSATSAEGEMQRWLRTGDQSTFSVSTRELCLNVLAKNLSIEEMGSISGRFQVGVRMYAYVLYSSEPFLNLKRQLYTTWSEEEKKQGERLRLLLKRRMCVSLVSLE